MKVLNSFRHIFVYYDVFDNNVSFVAHRSVMFDDYESCKYFMIKLKRSSDFTHVITSVVCTTIEELLPYD